MGGWRARLGRWAGDGAQRVWAGARALCSFRLPAPTLPPTHPPIHPRTLRSAARWKSAAEPLGIRPRNASTIPSGGVPTTWACAPITGGDGWCGGGGAVGVCGGGGGRGGAVHTRGRDERAHPCSANQANNTSAHMHTPSAPAHLPTLSRASVRPSCALTSAAYAAAAAGSTRCPPSRTSSASCPLSTCSTRANPRAWAQPTPVQATIIARAPSRQPCVAWVRESGNLARPPTRPPPHPPTSASRRSCCAPASEILRQRSTASWKRGAKERSRRSQKKRQ